MAQASAQDQDQDSRPNVILIMADDLGFETLGCYGSAVYETPVLDELARTGIRFEHCYSQPLCTPSRVQIMTGRYNFRNYGNFGVFPPEEVTFGHVLQAAGYVTCVAGKWQLRGLNSARYLTDAQGAHPDDAGFDDYCLWQVTRGRREGERYADPLIVRKGREAAVVTDGYGPDVFTDFIVDFIEENKDRPFFAYYPMVLTHDPFVPTPTSEGWSGDRYARGTDNFAHMVSYMDGLVGRIIEKLEETGLRERTLVIFTGDNGTHRSISSRMRSGRVIKGDKGQPTDGGTRVPLIANWPGVSPSGLVSSDLIDFTDFFSTVVELAGAELPFGRLIDGVSFAPQLRGQPGSPREWVLCHYDPQWGGRESVRFARNQRWKLFDDGRLYDLATDPEEKSPVMSDDAPPAARDVVSQLKRALREIQ